MNIFLPPTESLVQVIRVVVPKGPKPLAIFDSFGTELCTQEKPCLVVAPTPSVELCAIAFAGSIGFDGYKVAFAKNQIALRPPHGCVPADPVPAWSRSTYSIEASVNTEVVRRELVFNEVEAGPIRATFASETNLIGLRVLIEATVYHGLPFIDFDVTLENSAAEGSPGHVEFDQILFNGPAGSTVIARDAQGVNGFVPPVPGEPFDGWMRGTGRVRLTPSSDVCVIHAGSEWSCSFALVPTMYVTHPTTVAFVESPGYAQVTTGHVFLDGIEDAYHDEGDAPVVDAARAAATKAIDAFLAEREAGVKHSGSFPAGPSTAARGVAGNALRHPLGQNDGGPTGSLAADPRAYEAHLIARHPRIEQFLREQEHGMFDRARVTLRRDGAPYEPRGVEDFTLQRNPPGEPFARKTNAPHGWFEARESSSSSTVPHTHGSPDDQHYALMQATLRRFELTNSRSARRRLEVLADAAHAHNPDPGASLRGIGLGTNMGRGEAWRLMVILERCAMRPNDRDKWFIERMIETAVAGQTKFGNVRMDSTSKEFAGNDSTYGRDVISKRWGVSLFEVPALVGTSVYQESVLACEFEKASDMGFKVPFDFRRRHFDFVWHEAVSEGARAPWYRVVIWLNEHNGRPAGVEPAAWTTSDFNAQHLLAYGRLRGYPRAEEALRRWCFDSADPQGWLSSGKADKFANRGALLSVLAR